MNLIRIASAIALLSLLTAPTMAAPPLAPTAKWNVDFGDAHCIAMRDYGTAAKPLMLAFKPSPIGDVMQLSVVRANAKNAIDQYDGMIVVDQALRVKVSVLGYPAATGPNRIDSINLPLSDFAPLRTAKFLDVRSSGEIDVSFALSDMAPVTRALDRCVAGLRSLWNIADAAGRIRQGPRPLKPLTAYFKTEDYPTVAVLGNVSGKVEMMTLVDEGGKVQSCMVIATSGYASLDAQSCAIITTRAKFAPALGLDGKPAKSGTMNRIRWVMP